MENAGVFNGASKAVSTAKGASLGLGLGLGAMGPVRVGGLVAAAGYGVYRYRKNCQACSDVAVSEAAEAEATA